MKSKGLSCLLVALLLSALPATRLTAGDETLSDSVKYTFNPIIVTADKAEGPLRDVDATISVLPASLPRILGATTVPEALVQAVPGLFVSQRGVMGYGIGPGAAGTITMRGIGGFPNTQVLILVEGRPDFMGMMGHPLPDAYDLESAERIEVVRGPASVLYGSNAMGGVINIIPRRVRRPGTETHFKARGGSWDTRLFSAQHGSNFGKWDYYLTAAVKHTDGHRPESRFDGQNYSFRTAFRPDPRLEISSSGYVADYKSYDPGPVSNPYVDHWVDVLRSGLDLQVRGKTIFGTGTVRLFGSYGRHDIYDGWHSIDRTFGVTAYLAAKPFPGNLTTVGLDAMRYGGHGVNRIFGKDFGRHYITQWAPYAHVRQVVTGRLIVSGGLRLEHHQLFGYELIPKLGLVFEPGSFLALRVSSGKGFRSPTIRELYLFPAPTPTLKPERLWNNEVGIQFHPGNNLIVDLTAFQAKGSNLIRVEGRYPSLRLTNSGSFVHKGVEWDATWRATGRTHLRFFGSLLDPDKQTRLAPKRRFGFTATTGFAGWELVASVSRVEELYGEDNHRDRLPDYTLVDLVLSYRVWQHLRVLLRVQNLLDTDYQMMLGYPMPGRTISVELGASL